MEFAVPENSTIISINDDFYEGSGWDTKSGLHIETDKGAIKLLISNGQQCCENWDYLFLETPDNIDNFIGATIISISDIEIPSSSIPEDANETQLKIVTSKGVLQFAVYNSHNGYYSHAVFQQVFDSSETYSL